MRALPVLAALITVATPAVAQSPMQMPTTPPGAADPSRVTAGTYAIEPAHTQVLFTLDHLGFSLFRGLLSEASGTLTLDPKNPSAAKLSVTVPVSSIYTSSKKLDEELVGPQWFDTQRFPTASFVSTSVVPGEQGWTLVNGNLTIHGQTRAVQMRVHFHGAGKSMMGKGSAIGFDGRIGINRSEFGMGRGVPFVSDHVELTIAAAFEQQ